MLNAHWLFLLNIYHTYIYLPNMRSSFCYQLGLDYEHIETPFCQSITIHINHVTRRTTHVSPHIKWNDDLSTDGGLKCTALVLPGLICIFQSLTTFRIDWRSRSVDVRRTISSAIHSSPNSTPVFCMYVVWYRGSSMPIPGPHGMLEHHAQDMMTDCGQHVSLSRCSSFLPCVGG